MKKFFRRIAGYLVTMYANRIYRKAVKLADKRHEKEKEKIYVIDSLIHPNRLVTCNRAQFRRLKRNLGINDRKFNVQLMMDHSWYHTPDRGGKGMDERLKEIRRLAFVRHLLERAGLLDS